MVWPTPNNAKWPQSCFPVNPRLADRKPYLGAWARSSFEQGALCALAAMSSSRARFCGVPGDACFQCHGIGPCVTEPPKPHYLSSSITTAIKTPYMSWIASRLCQRLLSPYLGMKALLHSGAKGNGRLQLTSPSLAVSACLRAGTSHNGIQLHPMKTRLAAVPYAVLASPASIADGHRSSCVDVPMAAPRGAEVSMESRQCLVAPKCSTSTRLGSMVAYRMTAADHCIAAFNLRGAYGPSMSQMFSTHGGQSLPEGMLPRAPLRSHANTLNSAMSPRRSWT